MTYSHYIDGSWQPPISGRYLPVYDPCTGKEIAQVAQGDSQDVARVMAAAQAAQVAWSKVPTAERAQRQHRAADLMRHHRAELAGLLTQELGRPLSGCEREIDRSAELLDYYAEEALRLQGSFPLNNLPGEKALVTRVPVGVVLAITPFNYPITLLTFKLGAALMMGCPVVAKPAEDTPLSTLRLAELFSEAGYPAGTFNVITGYGHEIGDALVGHPVPAKVAFTGGTRTGQHIAALAVQRGKRLTLELGGQSPAIVCADADLAQAAPAIVKHAFNNSGQFCYRVNRVYAQRAVYDEFCQRLAEQAAPLKVGLPQEGSDLGPLVNEKIYRNSERQIADAQARGGRLLTGGERLTKGAFTQGWFLPPTVVADATHEMLLMTEETFGPVLGVMPFDEPDEAITLANDTPYGLAAYVFAGDVGAGLRLAEALDAGSVWVNNIRRSYHNVPFGGMKQSGLGREKSQHGLEAYTELKTIYLSY